MIISDKRYGLEIACPSCQGLLWLNITWAGLPKWFVGDNGAIDRPFKCAWCKGIALIGEGGNLTMIRRGLSISRIESGDHVIISEFALVEMIYKLISDKASRGHNIVIGGTFQTEEDFKTWCANIVSGIGTSHTVIRRPALDA